jgi:hypothetical protein
VHAESATREVGEQVFPDVREVLEVSQVGEAEEARNQVDVVDHGRGLAREASPVDTSGS